MIDNQIILSNDPSRDLKAVIGTYRKVGVLVDTNTIETCFPKVKEALTDSVIIKVAAGEQHKNLETCTHIWESLTHHEFDRHALLVVLGGGVLGDMGGFCAATFKRGIDFMLVPTTLLAQVDASIGGKLGIDFSHYKNHIGLFRHPVTTLVAPMFLETLPKVELKSGFAEVIKHCLSSDPHMWNTIRTRQLHQQDWEALIRHSIDFKSHIVDQDPLEKGLRKVLNVGHTVGHALEAAFLATGEPLTHGEAVAHGIMIESRISHQKGMLNKATLEEIHDFLSTIYGHLPLPDSKGLIRVMKQDKKNRDNKILMALIERIGQVKWDVEVSENEVERSLAYYHSL
ncbi:MAG: 3-dehydroquinate synthase [Cyclobacteriaceae bacterium]